MLSTRASDSIGGVSTLVDEPVPERTRIAGRPIPWICRAAIVLAIVGVLGTWRNAGPVSLDGVGGPNNGWLVIIFALIALAGVRSLARGSWLGIVTVLGSAAVMMSTAIHDVVSDNGVLGGSSGWGVWLTVAASAGLAACAILAAVWRVRPGAPLP